jgi:hypothetical protein
MVIIEFASSIHVILIRLVIAVENLTKRGIRVTDIVWNLNIRKFCVDGLSYGGGIARS